MREPTHFIDGDANHDDANSAMWTSQIQTFSTDQLMKMLTMLEQKWKINERNNRYLSSRIGYDNFFTQDELTEDGLPIAIDIERVSGKYTRMHDRLCDIYHRAETLNLMDMEDDNDMKLSVRVNRLIDQVDDAWQIVFRNARINERINNPTYVPINPESDPSIFRTSTITNVEELSPYQQAILQTLR